MLNSVGMLLDKELRRSLIRRFMQSKNGHSHVMYKKYDNFMGWSIITVTLYVISALLLHRYPICLNPKIMINENGAQLSGLRYIRLRLNVSKMRSLVHLF